MPRLIDADALLTVPNVQKVTEYDETGCGITYLAVPVEAIEKAPVVDAEFVRHEGTTTFITANDLDKYQPRIIVDEGEKSKFCRVFYEDDRTHGRWIDKPTTIKYISHSECSVCGSWQGANWMNYCPHCGAKMDGGAE